MFFCDFRINSSTSLHEPIMQKINQRYESFGFNFSMIQDRKKGLLSQGNTVTFKGIQ